MRTGQHIRQYSQACAEIVLLFLIAIIVIWPSTTYAQATTLTVCSSGCDHTSIQDAHDAAFADDVIEVRDATHTENNISLSKQLTIQGQAGTQVIIQAAASAGTDSGRIFTINAPSLLSITITNLTLRYGDAATATDDNGGAILLEDGTVTLRKVTIMDNEAYEGGGIAVTGGTMTLENVTIYRNTSTRSNNNEGGGGIHISGAGTTVNLYNCTITGNTTGHSGGIGGLLWDGISTVNVYNTILANSTNGDDCRGGNFATNTTNLIETNDNCSAPAVSADPGLGTFNYYEDESATVADTQTFSLLATSLAIDAGTDMSALYTDDQRSYDRPYDGDGDGTSTWDIGAYEYVSAAAAVACDPPTHAPLTPLTLGQTDFNNHAYSTFLFLASYDWLHHFTDRNTEGRDYAADPDTDNFNKIIVLDSNLFPIMTALYGDYEFPNITGRNAGTWDAASDSPYTPSTNDYFNRDIALAPNFVAQQKIAYPNLTIACTGGEWLPMTVRKTTDDPRKIQQYGGRSFAQWAFIADPGNHNIRRYEFQKVGGYYQSFSPANAENLPDPGGEDFSSVCNNAPEEFENSWVAGDTDQVLFPDYNHTVIDTYSNLGPPARAGTCDPETVVTDTGDPGAQCFEDPEVMFMCKHNQPFTTLDSLDDPPRPTRGLVTYINSGQEDPPGSGTYAPYPYLELISEIPLEAFEGGTYNLQLDIKGGARDSGSRLLAVGINTECGDNRPFAAEVTGTASPGSTCTDYAALSQYDIVGSAPDALGRWWDNMAGGGHKRHNMYSFTVTEEYDIDTSTPDIIEVRVRIYALGQGGFVIEGIEAGERDSAFAVKYEGPDALFEARWSVLTSFLETVPPHSYPGYTAYSRRIGYGFKTNTSFSHAENVRFKNPRDVDLYRDMFDSDNGGPVYLFVADTMNSRVQVFMNATASAGTTNAGFPIRPVRVKGPYTYGAYSTNELARPLATAVYADGRKADWRHYTTVGGRALAGSRIPADAGRGEFYHPHGVAVDQDPNTKDVYLFVADTFNHRIQVFRDATGVTFHNITAKRFDFEYEEGWGSYPLQTSNDPDFVAQPGPFSLRYPKGLDVVRFSNNSAYLYVVDSKDYRVLKYLITEEDSGGISNVEIKAGYGYNGTTFARNLTTMMGVALEAHRSFEEMAGGGDPMRAVGFWNPQDVATGYSGFYLYSAPNVGGYPYEVYTTTNNGTVTRTRGVQFLNNYMVYMSDYARNQTSIAPDRLNMRVMQFYEHPQRNYTSLFPWKTEVVTFDLGGTLGQTIFGPYSGYYNSSSVLTGGRVEGSTENVPGRPGYFTDRPVGVAALTWTTSPFDLRLIDLNATPKVQYPNGAIVDNDTLLRVGVQHRGFFGLPYANVSSYTNFTAERMNLDARGTARVHVFCYNTSGVYANHTALSVMPFEFTPGAAPLSCPAGYMKIVAEDTQFGYSGKTGTMIFRLID